MVVANIAIPDPDRLSGVGSSKIGRNICGSSNTKYIRIGGKQKFGGLGIDMLFIASVPLARANRQRQAKSESVNYCGWRVKTKTAAERRLFEFLVARGGIEPPTQGFSRHLVACDPYFISFKCLFCVMCDRLCYAYRLYNIRICCQYSVSFFSLPQLAMYSGVCNFANFLSSSHPIKPICTPKSQVLN